MIRPFALFITVLGFSAAQAQKITEVDIPEVITVKDYKLDDSVKKLYKIEYAVKLEDRELNDGTTYTDTLLSKNKEVNVYFNEDGYLTSHKVDSFDEKGKTIFSREKKYHYNGNKITGILHFEDGKQQDSTYIEYDRKGLIDEQVYYDRKGRKLKTVQYFHRRGRIFNVKVRDEEGMLVNFVRFEYDAAGNLKEQEVKGSNMQYLFSYKYEYDTLENGNRQVNKYDYVGQYKFRKMFAYLEDKKGNMTQWTIADSTHHIVDYRTMTYNDKNLKETELIFKQFKYDYTYAYTYNDKGYWRTQYQYESGKPVRKVHRVMEYKTEEGR